ncbi:replication/maintenance protein RepL [Escherichia coli]|nr:replication/maintenance protein RepL [Escherichia coli]
MNITERRDSKKKVLRQNITEVIDRETGNVTQEITDITVQFPQEPAYVKIYIDNLCAVTKAPDSLKDVLFLILRKLDYDGYIALSTRYRKEICKLLGIKDGTLRNRLYSLSKMGIIASCGGNEYQANPNLFARGEWKKIIEQRREFEMRIKYSPNGETIITTEEIK